MTLPHRILLSLALAATPPLTMAQDIAIPVTNFSFEALAAPQGGFPVGVPEGWTLFDPGGIVNQSANATGVLNPTGTTFFFDPCAARKQCCTDLPGTGGRHDTGR